MNPIVQELELEKKKIQDQINNLTNQLQDLQTKIQEAVELESKQPAENELVEWSRLDIWLGLPRGIRQIISDYLPLEFKCPIQQADGIGTCDSPEQFARTYAYFEGVLYFDRIDRQEQPSWGGWRWHKNGPYFGLHRLPSFMEYLVEADGSMDAFGRRKPKIDIQYSFRLYPLGWHGKPKSQRIYFNGDGTFQLVSETFVVWPWIQAMRPVLLTLCFSSEGLDSSELRFLTRLDSVDRVDRVDRLNRLCRANQGVSVDQTCKEYKSVLAWFVQLADDLPYQLLLRFSLSKTKKDLEIDPEGQKTIRQTLNDKNIVLTYFRLPCKLQRWLTLF